MCSRARRQLVTSWPLHDPWHPLYFCSVSPMDYGFQLTTNIDWMHLTRCSLHPKSEEQRVLQCIFFIDLIEALKQTWPFSQYLCWISNSIFITMSLFRDNTKWSLYTYITLYYTHHSTLYIIWYYNHILQLPLRSLTS